MCIRDSIYTMEYYSAIRRDEILPFATTWMDLEIIMLSEISQTEKVIYTLMFIAAYSQWPGHGSNQSVLRQMIG